MYSGKRHGEQCPAFLCLSDMSVLRTSETALGIHNLINPPGQRISGSLDRALQHYSLGCGHPSTNSLTKPSSSRQTPPNSWLPSLQPPTSTSSTCCQEWVFPRAKPPSTSTEVESHNRPSCPADHPSFLCTSIRTWGQSILDIHPRLRKARADKASAGLCYAAHLPVQSEGWKTAPLTHPPDKSVLIWSHYAHPQASIS